MEDPDHPVQFQDFPIEVVTDILSRLPVKTLIRSTSVCKPWYSLITNPNFIISHLKKHCTLSNNVHHRLIVVVPTRLSDETQCSIITDNASFTEVSKLKIPFSTDSHTVKLIGSFNGLLCLTDEDVLLTNRKVYLWNPSVRKHKIIASSCFVNELCDWVRTYPVLGFGFHKESNDYKIVRIVYFNDDMSRKVEVYSLRTCSWKRVRSNVPRTAYNGSMAFVNGAVHWLAANKAFEPFESIMAFDLNDEKFREIILPAEFVYRKGMMVDVLEIKGLLALSVVFPTDCYRVKESYRVKECCYIWMMKEYGSAQSWTKRLKIVLKDFIERPLGFTKSGKLIFLKLNGNLVSCDFESLRFKDLGIDGPYTVGASFMESLVLLEKGNAPLGQTL